MSNHTLGADSAAGPTATRDEAPPSQSQKRSSNHLASDPRYPRKRSLKACHVCRARKTKCDNVRPVCGFCASVNVACSYDDTETDHSTFDPGSLAILSQLSQVLISQDELLQLVRSVAASQAQQGALHSSPSVTTSAPHVSGYDHVAHRDRIPHHPPSVQDEWFMQQPDSASSTPIASTSVAAVRWFELLANDASRDIFPEAENESNVLEGGFLDPFNNQDESTTTPLQQATKLIDGNPEDRALIYEGTREEDMWQASENISLLEREQVLYRTFLYRICPWLDLFDTSQMFSTRVPHLAARNAGLLNAILALSSYHQSLDETIPNAERTDQNAALQYYYQTLHYVQKAMRYSTYKLSLELMATTVIVSTYEMLRGSVKDWQQHLQGVFWILRSRQIEVEASSLESTTWWAWLRQDIWVAFRERRRCYSTWAPKKTYAELSTHELALRAVWILSQVVNFCAVDASTGVESEGALVNRLAWAKALRKMLQEWESHLTVEFSELPHMGRQETEVFQARVIHPQCFGLAMQIHHVSKILVSAYEPSAGGIDAFMQRQRAIQDSIEVVCGIGTTIDEDASSVMSSQCLFIAGMFIQEPRKRTRVLEMLECFRKRCRWPASSLGSELEQIWTSQGDV